MPSIAADMMSDTFRTAAWTVVSNLFTIASVALISDGGSTIFFCNVNTKYLHCQSKTECMVLFLLATNFLPMSAESLDTLPTELAKPTLYRLRNYFSEKFYVMQDFFNRILDLMLLSEDG